MPATLVLGGARSGKSAYAQARVEEIARHAGGRPVFIATGQALDDEMATRIERHRADRSQVWTTIEAPLDLSDAVAQLGASDVALVDCLTLWLSNLMLGEQGLDIAAAGLVDAVKRCPGRLFLVSNEVGQGIVPDNPLARRFRDEAGRLHQHLAVVADEVVLVVAGLPLWLKPAGGVSPTCSPGSGRSGTRPAA